MKVRLTIRRIVRNVVAKRFSTLPPKVRKNIVQLCNVIVDPELVGRFSPVTLAEAIIYVQREYPLCAACYHPVIGFEIHQYEYCTNQRRQTRCDSHNDYVPTVFNVGHAPRCVMTNCGHFTFGLNEICDCCKNGLLDNSAKAAFLATFADESYRAHVSAVLAGAPRFSAMVKPIRGLMAPADTRNMPTDREV